MQRIGFVLVFATLLSLLPSMECKRQSIQTNNRENINYLKVIANKDSKVKRLRETSSILRKHDAIAIKKSFERLNIEVSVIYLN